MNGGNYDPLAPVVIFDANLSHAWGRILWHVVKTPGKEIKPLVISIKDFEDGQPNEDREIRDVLDAFLKAQKKWSVEIVAFTIFPQRYWEVAAGNRQGFYQICLDVLPFLKAKNPRLNSE